MGQQLKLTQKRGPSHYWRGGTRQTPDMEENHSLLLTCKPNSNGLLFERFFLPSVRCFVVVEKRCWGCQSTGAPFSFLFPEIDRVWFLTSSTPDVRSVLFFFHRDLLVEPSSKKKRGGAAVCSSSSRWGEETIFQDPLHRHLFLLVFFLSFFLLFLLPWSPPLLYWVPCFHGKSLVLDVWHVPPPPPQRSKRGRRKKKANGFLTFRQGSPPWKTHVFQHTVFFFPSGFLYTLLIRFNPALWECHFPPH